jgi:hypothetical protein
MISTNSPGGDYPPGAIAFIGCSKSKRNHSCSAKDMYLGELFKKAFKYCLVNNFTIYVLSAKYGLLSPNQIIDPYDQTLNTMSQAERRIWYDLVRTQLYHLQVPDFLFYFFCGEKYHLPFQGNKPLQGLSIGRQLQWFNQRTTIIKSKGFDL